MSLLLPEMPKELLDWDGERRIIKFPWNAPVCMVPYGPDKAPWRGQYRRRMEPLVTVTLRATKDTKRFAYSGAYGTLYVNLVVNDNGAAEDHDKPNMHLKGYGDMYLDVHFELNYPDGLPEDALIDPDLDYDEDPRWPKNADGTPVRHDDPRLPRWARPWDEVANGGFPIPEDIIAEVARQLAFKKHGVLNPLVQRWVDLTSKIWGVICRKRVCAAMQRKIADTMIHMVCTFEHPDVDVYKAVPSQSEQGQTEQGLTQVLMPRTVNGLKAMCAALNRCMLEHVPKEHFRMELDVESVAQGAHDLDAPHRTMLQEADRLELLIRRMQTGSAFDPAEEGFSCAEDLYNWACGDLAGKTLPTDTLRRAATVAWTHLEKNYPSREKLEADKREAGKLALVLTKHMSDEDVAKWFEKEEEALGDDVTVVAHDDEAAAIKKARGQSQLLPVLCMDLSEPARLICNERYGQCELPTGLRVLQPVADAYLKVLTERRDRGIASRTWRAKYNADWLATRPDAWPLQRPGPIRGPWPQPRPQPAPRPKSHADHVDAADLAAQTARNKEEAAKQREVRRQAVAAAAAKQPRAYTAAGQSHREGAPKWEDEVPDAGEKAKRDANREASKEARAKRRAEKKAAKRADVERRLRQFEQIRIGEAIGGSK